jgi:hypothetical protein
MRLPAPGGGRKLAALNAGHSTKAVGAERNFQEMAESADAVDARRGAQRDGKGGLY